MYINFAFPLAFLCVIILLTVTKTTHEVAVIELNWTRMVALQKCTGAPCQWLWDGIVTTSGKGTSEPYWPEYKDDNITMRKVWQSEWYEAQLDSMTYFPNKWIYFGSDFNVYREFLHAFKHNQTIMNVSSRWGEIIVG